MKILVIGESVHQVEFRAKFNGQHDVTYFQNAMEARKFLPGAQVVFDFVIDEFPESLDLYDGLSAKIFLNTSKVSIASLLSTAAKKISVTIYGFNGLPTFFNRSLLEVSAIADQHGLREIMQSLGTEFMVVDDRVGMVTPRVVCMIINEAYYTVQEGTASREDIDLAMKLGTNYPYGPFEWCERIGIKDVYELLDAMYDDTHDERYKICPLLKREYLRAKPVG